MEPTSPSPPLEAAEGGDYPLNAAGTHFTIGRTLSSSNLQRSKSLSANELHHPHFASSPDQAIHGTQKVRHDLRANHSPYSVITSSGAVLSRSNSVNTSAGAHRHFYVPPSPGGRARAGSNDDAPMRGHRASKSSDGPPPVPIPLTFPNSHSAHQHPSQVNDYASSREGAPSPLRPRGKPFDEQMPGGYTTDESTPRRLGKRGETLPSSVSAPLFPGSHGFPPAPVETPSLVVDDLPSNPKLWTPSQLARYLATALRLRPDADSISTTPVLPVPVTRDISGFVRESKITGRAFLRLNDDDLETMGVNQLWRTALLDASRNLRQNILKGRIWGFGNTASDRGVEPGDVSSSTYATANGTDHETEGTDHPFGNISYASSSSSIDLSSPGTSSVSRGDSGRKRNLAGMSRFHDHKAEASPSSSKAGGRYRNGRVRGMVETLERSGSESEHGGRSPSRSPTRRHTAAPDSGSEQSYGGESNHGDGSMQSSHRSSDGAGGPLSESEDVRDLRNVSLRRHQASFARSGADHDSSLAVHGHPTGYESEPSIEALLAQQDEQEPWSGDEHDMTVKRIPESISAAKRLSSPSKATAWWGEDSVTAVAPAEDAYGTIARVKAGRTGGRSRTTSRATGAQAWEEIDEARVTVKRIPASVGPFSGSGHTTPMPKSPAVDLSGESPGSENGIGSRKGGLRVKTTRSKNTTRSKGKESRRVVTAIFGGVDTQPPLSEEGFQTSTADAESLAAPPPLDASVEVLETEVTHTRSLLEAFRLRLVEIESRIERMSDRESRRVEAELTRHDEQYKLETARNAEEAKQRETQQAALEESDRKLIQANARADELARLLAEEKCQRQAESKKHQDKLTLFSTPAALFARAIQLVRPSGAPPPPYSTAGDVEDVRRRRGNEPTTMRALPAYVLLVGIGLCSVVLKVMLKRMIGRKIRN